MKTGLVTFAGAGPGAVDLLTLRCREAIGEADLIVFAGSLVNPSVLQFAKPGCVIHDSAAMDLPAIIRTLSESVKAGKKVLRLHTGDPAIYGAIAEQMDELDKLGVAYEVIPGVSSVFAAAAAAKVELTLPEVSQTIILTRRAGRTPVPAGQELAELARHGATLALFLSAGDMEGTVADLLAGGYSPDTPVIVVSRASWDDEKILRGHLSDIARQVSNEGISRQAIVMVGPALRRGGKASRLYAADFSHGYREATGVPPSSVEKTTSAAARFQGSMAIYALTAPGCQLANRLGQSLGATVFLSEKHAEDAGLSTFPPTLFDPTRLDQIISQNWNRFAGHIFIMAAGIVTRKIAPLLQGKTHDPAVVVCDENGRHAISLLSGHIGGANRLAECVAGLTGGVPVITTATDCQGIPSFDDAAAQLHWEIVNPAAIKPLNSLLLSGKRIGVVWPEKAFRQFFGARPNLVHLAGIPKAGPPADLEGLSTLDIPPEQIPSHLPVLQLRRQPVMLGIGCNRGASRETIETKVRPFLDDLGIVNSQIAGVATIDIKENEPGLREWTCANNWPLRAFPAEQLKTLSVPNPSSAVEKATGTPSVAEAAALLAGGGHLLLAKQKAGDITLAIATVSRKKTGPGHLFAAGIGPGPAIWRTPQLLEAIRQSDVIVGYDAYCDLIADLTSGKRVLRSGMRSEVERCTQAIDEALAGATVAVISSGDAGIYGMAGLLHELLEQRNLPDLPLEVVPGLTAATVAASVLGAPLSNDFAVISLSDQLTPRKVILQRLRQAAAGDFVCALYNPRSAKRTELLDTALKLFIEHRGGATAAGLVRHAGRPEQTLWLGPLGDLPAARVDMFTIVIIGNSQTRIWNNRLFTRRGYEI
ncbi:MAG: precorrin-4 C(11)-methyltransferase [Verrucomicrobiae bacterium]|nr:precorrin-4 C(11)-methyltransferase [Verrucomicrobiae bacterium]